MKDKIPNCQIREAHSYSAFLAINDSYLDLVLPVFGEGVVKMRKKITNVFYGCTLLLICVHAKGKVGGKGM